MSEMIKGIIVIDADYRISYASPLFSRLAGQRGAKGDLLCYQSLQQRGEPCEEDTFLCPLKQVQESGTPIKCLQTYLGAEREEGLVAVDCHPLTGKEGQLLQVICIVNELAEGEKVSADLDRMYRFAAIGRLFDGIAHNLNTPLSAVMARAEMLVERLKDQQEGGKESTEEENRSFQSKLDKCIRDAEVIVKNAIRLADIIKNMMQKGLHEGEETPQILNLSNVLKEEVNFLEADMKFKHELQKTLSLDESIPYVKGVYFHFSQSFTNIIKNAMESMDGTEVKELTIRSMHDNDVIVVEIHDTGEEAPHIAQGQHPLTSAEMRLVHTRELLKQYGGELKIRSKAHDNLYTIRIPTEG